MCLAKSTASPPGTAGLRRLATGGPNAPDFQGKCVCFPNTKEEELFGSHVHRVILSSGQHKPKMTDEGFLRLMLSPLSLIYGFLTKSIGAF